MKKAFTLAIAALLGFANISCANSKTSNEPQNSESKQNETTDMKDKKTLVAFFSRADENYNVGFITKGNTQIIAEMIADQTGADQFHIETVVPYPADYTPCIEKAREELRSKARPEIKGDINVEDYDVIFIGFPNWWGEPPMALYTFIEKHSWEGKTIIPFITHEGSGFGGTDRRVASACAGATALKGLAVHGKVAQEQQQKAKGLVTEWLAGLDFAEK